MFQCPGGGGEGTQNGTSYSWSTISLFAPNQRRSPNIQLSQGIDSLGLILCGMYKWVIGRLAQLQYTHFIDEKPVIPSYKL